MFKFRPTMMSLETRENPADLTPANPLILTNELPLGISAPPVVTSPDTTTPTAPAPAPSLTPAVSPMGLPLLP